MTGPEGSQRVVPLQDDATVGRRGHLSGPRWTIRERGHAITDVGTTSECDHRLGDDAETDHDRCADPASFGGSCPWSCEVAWGCDVVWRWQVA
jgi:hypothetical protein